MFSFIYASSLFKDAYPLDDRSFPGRKTLLMTNFGGFTGGLFDLRIRATFESFLSLLVNDSTDAAFLIFSFICLLGPFCC